MAIVLGEAETLSAVEIVPDPGPPLLPSFHRGSGGAVP
jgi:hypothetical protein